MNSREYTGSILARQNIAAMRRGVRRRKCAIRRSFPILSYPQAANGPRIRHLAGLNSIRCEPANHDPQQKGDGNEQR
jgi:hypothetical protein